MYSVRLYTRMEPVGTHNHLKTKLKINNKLLSPLLFPVTQSLRTKTHIVLRFLTIFDIV